MPNENAFSRERLPPGFEVAVATGFQPRDSKYRATHETERGEPPAVDEPNHMGRSGKIDVRVFESSSASNAAAERARQLAR
jgi:hypothetical protein